MITNTIAGPEFNTLIARMGQAEALSEFEDYKAKLTAFIDGWGLGLQHKAVEEFKAVCKYQGLVACDEASLDYILKASAIPREAYDKFERIKTSKFDTEVKVPDDLTPAFTVEDPDLNALLNDTAHMISGDNNMDTGMAWMESLERVVARLQPVEEERDHMAYAFTRYRVHMTVANTLGLDTLGPFKRGGGSVSKIIEDTTKLAGLLRAVEKEFKVAIPADVRQRLLAGTGEQFVDEIYTLYSSKAETQAAPTAEGDALPRQLDRVELESRLSKVALQIFAEADWKLFQDNIGTYGDVMLKNDGNECYDDQEFLEALGEEFKMGHWIDSSKLMPLTYVQFVDYLIEKGAK